jgi:hypothetical protein
VIHTEALDCPCKPVTVKSLGGGRVQVHRESTSTGAREPQAMTCHTKIELGVQDPYCGPCGTWHLRGNHVGEPGVITVDVRAKLLRDLEDKMRALPRRHFNNHTGDWIERAAVLHLLDPRA